MRESYHAVEICLKKEDYEAALLLLERVFDEYRVINRLISKEWMSLLLRK